MSSLIVYTWGVEIAFVNMLNELTLEVLRSLEIHRSVISKLKSTSTLTIMIWVAETNSIREIST